MEDDKIKREAVRRSPISIHVPRVEDDAASSSRTYLSWISIHVPRVEDDRYSHREFDIVVYFNPRPPCGGRRRPDAAVAGWKIISIHVPRVEDDQKRHCPSKAKEISIHVPRVEDDLAVAKLDARWSYFNPRPPCGGRPDYDSGAVYSTVFQSTSPVWRTTAILH